MSHLTSRFKPLPKALPPNHKLRGLGLKHMNSRVMQSFQIIAEYIPRLFGRMTFRRFNHSECIDMGTPAWDSGLNVFVETPEDGTNHSIRLVKTMADLTWHIEEQCSQTEI